MLDKLNIFTVLALTALNLVAVSLTLPWLMGRRVSRAARLAQASLVSQALGWIALLASGFFATAWIDQLLSTSGMVFASLAQYLIYLALVAWLGPRPGHRLLVACCLLMPLGYTLGFGHYAFRVGWANALLAVQLLTVARAALWPHKPTQRHWRWMIAGCHFAVAAFTIGRGVLGAFFTAQYPEFLAPHPINLGAQLVTNAALLLTTAAVLVAWRDEAEAQLRELAVTDGLTGVLNHRGWHAQAELAMADGRRHPSPMTVLLMDLDHFKAINDRHGHETGDAALRLFGQVMRDNLREGDLAGRLGGEEFVVLLRQGDAAAAHAVDQRMRHQLAASAPSSLGIALDFSSGVSVRYPDDRFVQPMLARADRALYQAKLDGRGRLVDYSVLHALRAVA